MNWRFGRPIPALMAALAVTACGSEKPRTVSLSEASATVRESAIPLREALASDVLELSALGNRSTMKELVLQVQPQVSSQPWIRFDPGLGAFGEDGKCLQVTHETRFVLLPKGKPYTVFLPHVQMQAVEPTGVPASAQIQPIQDERVLALLRVVEKTNEERTKANAAAKAKAKAKAEAEGTGGGQGAVEGTGQVEGPAEPVEVDWKDIQVAVWALAADVEFSGLRQPVGSGQDEVGTGRAVIGKDLASMTVVEIDTVMKLLERAGQKRNDFALWRGVSDELAGLIRKYDSMCDAQDVRALVPFTDILSFYPMEPAIEVLSAGFDRHQGKSGAPFRRRAVQVLARFGGPSEVQLVLDRSVFEEDPEIFDLMHKILVRAAAPAK